MISVILYRENLITSLSKLANLWWLMPGTHKEKEIREELGQ